MSFIIKCKMCGGDIELSSDQSFGTCEFCGSTMTLPKIDDEQRLSAFNRGNHFRRLGEFDKALAVYEHIIQEDETDSEAHWCCALCRFGIEYVHDPSSGEYIPTCHRASFDSFLEDVDYRAAVEHADIVTRKQYEDDAKNIEEVRRDILRISQNEKPYDVFICYKESDDHGQRTVDSQRAQEIYYQLTDQGWRVFFSRITLEDKAGQQYEPYIFAALNSAKVMIVVGTCRENLEAVWVKNEWGRFLAKIKKDRKKLLIPCYANMDPYDMPEQLSVLQSYDMTKIGFIQDLTRGISKVLNADKKQEAFSAKEQSGNVTALIKRGYMSLEDGDWKKADEFFEEVLNQDAECAQAYVGKALASEKCVTLEGFVKSRISRYKKAEIPSEKLMISVATQHIKDIAKKYAVPNYLNEDDIEELYYFVPNYLGEGGIEELNNLVQESIPQVLHQVFYKSFLEYDSHVSYFEEQRKVEEQYWGTNPYLKRALKFSDGLYKQELDATVQAIFSDLDESINKAKELESNHREMLQKQYADFLCETDKKVESLYHEACIRRGQDYQKACESQSVAADIEDYEKVIKSLTTVGDFKDAKERVGQCQTFITEIESRNKAKAEAEATRNEMLEKKAAEEKAKRKKRNVIAVGSITVVAVLVLFIVFKIIIPKQHYEEAISLYESEDYMRAYTMFSKLGDYRDSSEKCESILIENAVHETISAGSLHTVGIRSNGKVMAVGENTYGPCNVKDWTDIIAVSAGDYNTMGLRSDGTVVAVGLEDAGFNWDVSDWKDVVEVSVGGTDMYGLKSNGRVVSTGENAFGKGNVENWTDIISIDSGSYHTVGLHSDGTVIAIGYSDRGQCDVDDWADIVAISTGDDHTVGLRSNGTVVATGKNAYGECNVGDWTDIVAISAGRYHTVGLRSDGTVVAVGNNGSGQCDLEDWTDIIAISAGNEHTIGLRANGTVVAKGSNDDGQCDVEQWKNIMVSNAK